MLDPLKAVAANIVYWCQVNNPKEGAATLSEYWSTLRVGGFKDLQYGAAYPVTVDPSVIETAEFSNGSSVADKQTFTVNKTTTDSSSWSLKEGISTKVSGGAEIPFLAKGKVEVSVSFESTQSSTHTDSRSWTYSSEVNVPAKKRIRTSFIVAEGKYKVPFTAKVPVRGKVWVQFASGKWWGGVEIDEMITNPNLRWNPATFDAVLEGTFEGVHGMDYQVKVEEFELMLAAANAASAAAAAHASPGMIIDAGVALDEVQSANLTPVAQLSAKGPE